MAFNVGQAPVGILSRALTGNIFVEQNLAYMNEGNKDGYNVYKYDLKNVLTAAVADPTFSDDAEKANFKRSLTVLQSQQSFDPAEYHAYWLEYQPSGEFQWETLPTQVQQTMEELFLGSAAEAAESALTNDDGTLLSANSATTDGGIIDQLLQASVVSLNGVTPTPAQVIANNRIAFRADADGSDDNLGVVLTTANVFKKLELLIKNQTKEMRKRPNRKFMISNATADLITEAQRLELNFKGVDVTEAGVLRYAGYDLVQNPQFPDNTILFCSMGGDMKTDAIQLGTSLSSDFNNLAVDRISNFNRKFGMLVTFALDIFVVRPEEVCFYSDQSQVA
jgi:hypothetical protein